LPDPAEPFETWLLHRVAEAVEGNEVSTTLLTDPHEAIAEVRARPPEARDARALMDLAERVNLPVDDLTELLATLQAQPTAVRERFLRRPETRPHLLPPLLTPAIARSHLLRYGH